MTLDASAAIRVLGAVAIVLVLANIGGQFSKIVLAHDHLLGLVPLFCVDNEQNVPTFFQVLLLLLAALLLAVIAVLGG